MGFFERLLGRDPASRIERAARLLQRAQYSEARWELDGIEGAEAERLRAAALAGLVELNLEEARARYNAADSAGGAEHVELARQFGATPEQMRAVRRHARTLREESAREAASAQAPPPPSAEGDDPLWRLPPDDPRLRYAVLVETWPEDLRPRLAALGADFAIAVLALEDGDPKRAFALLGPFAEKDPVARLERARAALAAGDLPAAAADLRAFSAALGHRKVGSIDTAVALAQVLVQTGRAPEALAEVDAELGRRDDPSLEATRSVVLEAMGRLDEAERTAEKVLNVVPRDMGLYRLLARIRLKLDKRVGAMQALEGGLTTCCSSHGKCGSQKFDVEAGRMLARLYLEDRIERRRAAELMDELSKAIERPAWDDRYIIALAARNDGDPEAPALAGRLLAELGAGDPRRALVERAFTAA